jgi:hypothetical protein
VQPATLAKPLLSAVIAKSKAFDLKLFKHVSEQIDVSEVQGASQHVISQLSPQSMEDMFGYFEPA